MHVNSVDNVSFKIYKSSSPREYGQYMLGQYKDYRIEVYDAYKYRQKLIYVTDKVKNFIKSKLIYWQDGKKKVTRAECTKKERSTINELI